MSPGSVATYNAMMGTEHSPSSTGLACLVDNGVSSGVARILGRAGLKSVEQEALNSLDIILVTTHAVQCRID